MSTTVSGVGGCSGATQAMSAGRANRPSVSDMVDKVFSQIDTQDRGYIDESDLQAALTQTSSAGGQSASAGDMIKALDSDSDGKVTKQEMSGALQKLSDEFDSRFGEMRMKHAGGHGHMPPPPPPDGDDAGATKDPLTATASDAAAVDSARTVSSADGADSAVMKQVMRLVHHYSTSADKTAASVSVSA